MGSDENVHQSQLLALVKARVVTQLRTHPPSVAICEMAQLKHSCCHTSYTAICILCTLCVSSPQCGLCGELYEAHEVCTEVGARRGLQRLLETGQINGDVEH